MISALTVVTLFSGLSFIFYGLSCLLSQRMVSEFKRFGLDKQRKLTGILQLIGGTSLMIGYFYAIQLAAFSALGLGILMLLGFMVRLKIKDSLALSAPSLLYALLNLYLAIRFFGGF